MFTRPADLDDDDLSAAASRAWDLDLREVSYLPVGFGSHHWVASGPGGRWFITVDDLDACLNGADDSRDGAFDRLGKAFQSARLLADAGLRFVVAPIRDADGEILRRLSARHSILVHHFLDGSTPAGRDGAIRPSATEALQSLSSPNSTRRRPSSVTSPSETTCPYRSATSFWWR